MCLPLKRQKVRTLLLLPVCGMALASNSPAQDVVCSGGFGSFKSASATGVTVFVGATRNTGFAGRACEGKLAWDNKDLLVESSAYQVDVDAMGIDLGLGSPVVAFQINATDIDRLATYEIYSLKKPPRRLRTIKGGDSYAAADTDLDGRIEIWTSDAGAVNGFEDIPLSALDFAPTVVLRFEQKRLVDVGSEFVTDFDRQIAAARTQLNTQQLSLFKQSDGALTSRNSMPIDQAHGLLMTKIKVLEIVWSYLYSEREQEAWNALAEMWPASDVDRIRAAILKMRASGIRSQMDDASHRSSPGLLRKKHAMIYDRIADVDRDRGNPLSWDYSPAASGPTKNEHLFEADTFPVQILLRRPPPPVGSEAASSSEVTVNLVIDAAGKVRSASAEGKPEKVLMDATASWKFIPAFKDGHPVATRLQIGVTLAR
jgi:hypothetical protein